MKNPYNEQTRNYIQSIDDMLKRKKGGFSAVGYDTSSNRPFSLPSAGLRTPVLPASGQDITQIEQMPQIPQGDILGEQVQGKTDAASFLNQVANTPRLLRDGIQSLSDGGVLLQDGSIAYPDGSSRTGDPSASPVMTMADGSVGYSDGSVRQVVSVVEDFGDGTALYSDGSVRTKTAASEISYDQLQQMMFGNTYETTQEFGNYNPTLYPGSGQHIGTDIGVAYQQLSSPFTGRVVERLYAEDGNPYGNSVLVQLPTGEMLRFSHLSMSNLQDGDTINAGDMIGVTGNTGNSTGPHLDLEYYTVDGKVGDIRNFTGLTNPDAIGVTDQMGSKVAPAQLSPDKYEKVFKYREENNLPNQSEAPQQPTQPMQSFMPQPDPYQLPANEQNIVGQVSQGLENIGAEAGAPELFVGEVGGAAARSIRGQPLPENIAQLGSDMGIQERGISELTQDLLSGKATSKDVVDKLKGTLASKIGDFKQGVENIADTSQNIGQKVNASLVGDKILAGIQGARDLIKSSNLPEGNLTRTALAAELPTVAGPSMQGTGIGQIASASPSNIPMPSNNAQPNQSQVLGASSKVVNSSKSSKNKSESKSSGSKAVSNPFTPARPTLSKVSPTVSTTGMKSAFTPVTKAPEPKKTATSTIKNLFSSAVNKLKSIKNPFRSSSW